MMLLKSQQNNKRLLKKRNLKSLPSQLLKNFINKEVEISVSNKKNKKPNNKERSMKKILKKINFK